MRNVRASGLRGFLLRGGALLGALLLAGCVGPSTPPRTTIDIDDSGVFVPSARASIAIPRSYRAPAHPQSGHAIELGVSVASGSDTQTLRPGDQPVVLGGETFNPSQELRHEFDFTFLEAAYRFRWLFNSGLGIEAGAGLAHADFDLTVSGPAQRASESVDSPGVIVSFGLLWRLLSGTALQARATLFGSGDDDGVTYLQRYEISFLQALGRNLAVRAGYVSWNAESERDERSVSPIEIRFSGPALGLELAF